MSTASEHHLSIADYVVFGLMLVISGLIGIYYKLSGGRQQTTEEYLLADKQMSVIPVSFSLMASFMSAISLLGVSAEHYMFGTQFIVVNIPYIVCTPIAANVFLPVFYHLNVVSVYEYLEKRFDRRVRSVASLVFSLQMIFYMSIVLYAPALALNAATGLDKWLSITSVGLVCTLYCAIGGIKAVIWTDLFQSILMFAAMIIIIVKGSLDVGGLAVVWQRAQLTDRIEFFNIDPNPMTRHTVWSLLIGGSFVYCSLYCVNQTQVQRLMTVKTLKKSQMTLWINGFIVAVLSVLTSLTGLVIFANFWKCDPLLKKEISKSDQLLPYYVMRSLSAYPGLPGLIIAGIFSGALSSVSSFVNSLAAVSLEDYVKPCLANRLNNTYEVLISKLLAVFYGILCVLLTIVADQMPALLQATLTVFGVVGGPLLALFTVGMCCRWCTSSGALSGFIVSLAVGLWLGFGNLLYGSLPEPKAQSVEQCSNTTLLTNTYTTDGDNSFSVYRISYMWFSAITTTIGICVSLVISKFTSNSKPIDDSLLATFLRIKTPIERNSSENKTSEL